MKEKKNYKSVLVIVLTLLALIVITKFTEPHPWAAAIDPSLEQTQSEVSNSSIFKGLNTPWCCEWTSGLQN
ncbi:MAG: hypothetical protein Q8S24_11355 [Eubacteriales bacterium]|nr:hypothetical protein [Eubacteriales bacterium]